MGTARVAHIRKRPTKPLETQLSLLSVKELAIQLRVCSKTIRRWVKSKFLPSSHVLVGKRFFRKSEIERWFNSMKTEDEIEDGFLGRIHMRDNDRAKKIEDPDLALPCGHCLQPIGKPCVNGSGLKTFTHGIRLKKKTAPDGSGGGPLLTADQILSYQTRLQTALREIRSVCAQTPGEWSRRVWNLADDALASTPFPARKTGPPHTATPRYLAHQKPLGSDDLAEEETSESPTPAPPDGDSQE